MIDVYKYTKDTYKHVPNRYAAHCNEIVQIYEKKITVWFMIASQMRGN